MKAKAKLMCVVAVALAAAAGMPQLAGATTLPGETNSSPQGVMLEEYLERNGGLVWALCRRIGVLRIEMNSLPEHSWFTSLFRLSDKRSHKELLDSYVFRLRGIFLRSSERLKNDSGQRVDPDAHELAIVSRCIGFVVDHLQDLISRTDNIESTRRYVQSYIGALTVLQSSHALYFSKASARISQMRDQLQLPPIETVSAALMK